MSQQLINLSPDLKKLQDEGYEVEVVSGHLLIKSVPYLNSNREIRRGVLISTLCLSGDVTARPDTHVINFIGDYPCHMDGSEIGKIRHQSGKITLGANLIADHSFSSKPPEGYANYFEKMTTYVDIICGPAQAIDASVTAKTFAVVEPSEGESVFNYLDTASSHAGIAAIAQKLELDKIAIIGLGGTGSYVLDLTAKTPVSEIHLFDGDIFLQHNAFRAPGAASVNQLRERLPKVLYFKDLYSNMRQGIIAHAENITNDNIGLLSGMKFVFLCLDKGAAKRIIIDYLEEAGIPFIDVGMGLHAEDGSLGGVLRITTSTGKRLQKQHGYNRIPFSDGDADEIYSKNIQVADLNALNAALAVLKWKKIFGFYRDLENEHFCTFTLDGNSIINEDSP